MTSWVHQGYLEPQVAMAEIDDDGILHITSATQGTFHTRSELAKLFGRSIASVRVTGATLGGGFGGKLLVIEPLAAAATLVLRRPVRVELTRLEDFRMTNPAPASILEVALGATRDGRLRGLRARILFETGGFSENSVEGIAAILTVGPYHWDAHEVVAYGVETNRVATGAYRRPARPRRRSPSNSCSTNWPAASRSTRSSFGGATSSHPTTRWPTGRRGAGSASTNASSGCPTIRSIATGRRSPTARVSGSRSGRGRAAASPPRPSAASRRTGE